VGFSVTEETVTEDAGVMVRKACTELDPRVAVMTAVVVVVTVCVPTVNVALVAPDGTITLVGTVAAATLLESVTVAPPGGKPLNVTVP
jgi:hypothetical protein